MAGVLKARDAAGTLRTISAAKARGTDGTLRTLQFVRVRGTDGLLHEVFTTGGGGSVGAGSANPASIAPGTQEFSGRGTSRSATFTAMSSGAGPSAYSWGLLDGNGGVQAGATTQTATLRCDCAADDTITSTFFCDMTIGGTVYRATCSLTYSNQPPGGTLA